MINNDNQDVIKDLTLKADSLLSQNQWSEALKCYLEIIRRDMYCAYSNIQKARKCISQLNFSRDQIKEVLKTCCFKESKYVNKIKDIIFEKDTKQVSEIFSSILYRFLDDPDAIKLWQDSFYMLLESINFRNKFGFDGDENYEINSRTIIFVSGMGWSGSGAINCYLSEFDEIKKISGEFPMFEQDFGLKDFVKNINSREKFIFSVVDFIFLHLLGIFPYISLSNIISARFSSKAAKKNQLEYAKKSYKIIRKFAYLICNYDKLEKIEILKYIGNGICNFIIDDNKDKILLLDNAVHIYNIELINYIDNVNFFCVVRDPRSNYVAQQNENPGFNLTYDSYAEWYRNKFNKLNKNIKEMSNPLSHIYVIQFERFITSESYRRNEIINKINPNLTHIRKYSNFKPWESLFNALNYEKYENKEEIDFLHNELSDYCIDVDLDMIMDVMYDCASENARLQSIINEKGEKSSESNFGLRKYTKTSISIWNKSIASN